MLQNKYLIKKIIGVSGIIFLSSICFFLANIILGRMLSKEDYGYFQFIRTVTFILPSIVILGMDVSFIRFFSKKNVSKFNWFRNLLVSIRNTSILSIPIVLFIILFYQIQFFHGLIIYLILLFYGFLLLGNSILRVNSQYFKAQFLTSGWRIIFFLFVLFLFIINSFTRDYVIKSYFISFVIFVVFALIFLKKITKGKEEVSNKKIFGNGFLFFLITVSGIIMTQLDRFFISKILGFEALGIYVAVSVVIITIFNLTSTSIGFVLMPYLAKGKKINKKKLAIFIISITIVLSLFFLFFTQHMNHIFYNGRYDGHQNVINLFIIIGALQFLYNFIYFSLGGIGEKVDFIRFFYSIGISIIIFIVLSLILIPKLNIIGAAIATAISWLIRDIGGIMILRKKRIHV